ncbi:MAG: acyl-CoA dehydrogenase family protein [Desulfobacterales bacterium]|jgi:alkylation response protein AidB-like acyl-CoA dehydrogenase
MAVATDNNSKTLYGLDPESRQMVIDMIGQLEKRLLVREKVLEWDKNEVFPEDTLRELLGPEIGLQLLMIPEAYGGMGGGARDSCDVTREMSKVCLGITTAFFALQLGADPLMVGGTEAQKAKWLGKIAEGKALVAYAVTEPDAGSNVAAIKTKADPVKNESGKITGYKINGNKQFISTGAAADFITVLAKTPEGPTFFVIEKGAEGFTPGRSEEKHGIRASQTAALTFDNVFVPAENLIGGVPGKGLKQANQVFGYTRLMVAAMGLGAGEAALNIAVPYAKERVVSGSPLSEKQGYTHKLVVPNAVRLEAAAAYIYEVAQRLDAGEQDLQVEGSIAKYFATETADKTASDAMQALGGYGYISEFEVEKIKRDVKITCIYEGTSEVQQNIISTFRWRTTIKTKGEFYGSIAAEMAKLNKTFGDIGCRCYALVARILNETIMLVHNNKLTRKQYVMFALADMMTHLEVGATLACKAAMAVQEGNAAAEKLKAMSRVFASEVAQLVAQNVIKIVLGTGIFDKSAVAEFLAGTSYNELVDSQRDVISDMDKVADILFER